MTLSMQEEHCRRISFDEQLNQQTIGHLLKMNNDIKIITQQQENDDDGHYSDESNCSDDLRLGVFLLLPLLNKESIDFDLLICIIY